MNIRNYPTKTKARVRTISRLGQRRQVVIPKDLCEQLGLKEGDFVEVGMEKSVVVVKRKRLVDSDDILTPKEEKLVRKGETQLTKGKCVQWEDVKKRLKI